MGRVTGTFYTSYDRARHRESIMLTNLMSETIGSTPYRMALGRVQQPAVRATPTVLTRDESFHVPLNVHFVREVLRRQASVVKRARLQATYCSVFAALILSVGEPARRAAVRPHHVPRAVDGLRREPGRPVRAVAGSAPGAAAAPAQALAARRGAPAAGRPVAGQPRGGRGRARARHGERALAATPGCGRKKSPGPRGTGLFFFVSGEAA